LPEDTATTLKSLEVYDFETKPTDTSTTEVLERPPIMFEDGSVYIGTWTTKYEHKHGNGILITADGISYKGEWSNSVPQGKGVLLF